MNKWQAEVLGNRIASEEQVLKEIKASYKKALKEIDDKIAQLLGRKDTENLQSIIYQVEYQKALKTQISTILDDLNTKQFESVSQYLVESYQDGFIGTMYDLQHQGIPIVAPIEQKNVVRAIKTNTQLSTTLWGSLADYNSILQKEIRSEISRGISQGASYSAIARNLAERMNIKYNQTARIVRTEAHRISQEATMDAQYKAKEKGADIVKQWDATLDRRTRSQHASLDGQIKELDEEFEYGGHTAMHPSGFGVASLDINCRCQLLQRAKWGLDEEELKLLEERAAFFGLDKTEDYKEFRRKYLVVNQEQEILDVANKLIEEAKQQEPQITKDLKEIIGETHGNINYDVFIDGQTKKALDFRLKGSGSLQRKVISDFINGVPLETIEKELYDAVRYTDLVGAEFLTNDYFEVVKKLEKKGYKVVRVKNTLNNHTKAYRGLNTVVQSPSGYNFELQFHTPESMEIKEIVHKLYEKQRKDGITIEEYNKLNDEMLKISGKLEDIEGVEQIKEFNKFKDK